MCLPYNAQKYCNKKYKFSNNLCLRNFLHLVCFKLTYNTRVCLKYKEENIFILKPSATRSTFFPRF